VLHVIAIVRQVGGNNASVTALRILLGTEQTGTPRVHTSPPVLEPALCFVGHELLKGTYRRVLAPGVT
jgi:hypothetical protein